ncbi:hypothetical protein KO507_12710 [Gilvimarinus agarilyticus]|uniref:hypothetical protein n=1 Tax=Gilvimarinus sp. 2_MG-2023 TaxID=3062666 RepID=UPI001C09B4CB|nr:hypothetical protein [Gilvimarinus sp. 2_MG-2023]MBU2886626.1 hypothetical protein [Gilvimarinus agarilyticus]MDO6571294.1 hypothetical protein [Gilvimarinus sp. 2_MG-2023]
MRIHTFGAQASKYCSALALCLGLAACGGGNTGTALGNLNGDGSGNTDGDGDSATTVSIGYVDNGEFIPGEIKTNLNDNMLAPGGTTVLQVNLYRNDRLLGNASDVVFNSTCFINGEAHFEVTTITDGVTETKDGNIVTANNGTASIRYTATSCTGEDLIEATSTNDGIVVAASSIIPIAPDSVNTVTFVSSEPEYISLKGTGGSEASEVTFQIRGGTGAPVKDIPVNFALNTDAGGITLTQDNDISDQEGYVSTIIQSGSTPTSVRVSATTDNGVTTQSSRVVASTGLPDQNSMSIASELLYPVGWDQDGIESEITVSLADAFNNPVPKDTPVYFTTNGGNVEAACLTEEKINPDNANSDLYPPGTCAVTWRSSNPRPRGDNQVYADESGTVPVLRCEPNGLLAGVETECRNGRAIVMATTIGNESFNDNNNNGLYDAGETFNTATSTNGNPTLRAINCLRAAPISTAASTQYGCDDLGTPYIDRNFNGQHDPDEEIANIDNEFSNTYEPGNGIYNGALCRQADHNAGICSRNSVLVRDTVSLIMTSALQGFFLTPDGRIPGQPSGVLSLSDGENAIVQLLLADVNGNGLPTATQVEINSFSGVTATVTPSTIGARNEPTLVTIQLTGSSASSGIVSLTLNIDPDNDGGADPISYTIGHFAVEVYEAVAN